MDLFSSFMNDDMITGICEHTNNKLEELKKNIGDANKNTATYERTNLEEMRCFIGVLIMTGARKDSHLSVNHMFSNIYGSTFYKSLFSEKRFEFLLRCLRFDDIATRPQRMLDDPFAHVRDLWDCVIQNCRDNYIAGPIVTVDEQLLAFRGRCLFRVYIPSKPAKYGLKLFMVCDADTLYCLNALPDLGKASTDKLNLPKSKKQGHHFTMELLESGGLIMDGRTTTLDNWFTSLNLAKDMLKAKMHMVGTIRPKPYMPTAEIHDMQMQERESVAIYNHKYNVNMVYKKTKKKYVAFITTLHNKFTYVEKDKTEVNMYYNAAKGGVDAFDMMCGASSTNRKTLRWPLCIFYGLLNIIMNNSWIIFMSNPANKGCEKYDFLQDMAYNLSRPYAQTRYTTRFNVLPRITREPLQRTFNLDEIRTNVIAVGQKKTKIRKRCRYCPSKSSWSGRFFCSVPTCSKHVCKEHSVILCQDCWGRANLGD